MKYTAKEKRYRDYIRSLPCSVSGYIGEEIDPHHIKGYSWVTGSGTGKKGVILTMMPLKHDLHQELHNIGWQSFEREKAFNQAEACLKAIVTAFDDGIIGIK